MTTLDELFEIRETVKLASTCKQIDAEIDKILARELRISRFNSIEKTSLASLKNYKTAVRDYKIATAENAIMEALKKYGPMTCEEIASVIGESTQFTQALLSRMKNKEHLEKSA